MLECRQGQNTGHDNPCFGFRGKGVLKEFFVAEMYQGIIKPIACSIEGGGATLEADDLGLNRGMLVNV